MLELTHMQTHTNTNTLTYSLAHTLPHGEVVKGHGWLGAAGLFRPEWQSCACWDVWIQMQSSMKAWGRSLLFSLISPFNHTLLTLPFLLIYPFLCCRSFPILAAYRLYSFPTSLFINTPPNLPFSLLLSIHFCVYSLWVFKSSSQLSLIDFHLTSISHLIFV